MNRRDLSLLAVLLLLGAASLVLGTPCFAAEPEQPAKDAKQTKEEDSVWSDLVRDLRPALDLQYGITDVSRDGFTGSFGPAALLDLRAGYLRESNWLGREDLVSQLTVGVQGGRMASSLSTGDVGHDEAGLDAWRFGFGSADGSGYRLGSGDMRLVFLTGRTGGWYFVDFDLPTSPVLGAADSLFLARFDSASPWGDAWEGSIRFCINRPLSLQVSYERAVTLPGFKIWYYLLSNAIDTIALSIADRFTEAVADASPKAGPVVGFLLRSGIQYGFYELRQEQMHWPFDTEAPLAFDSYKFGFGMAF